MIRSALVIVALCSALHTSATARAEPTTADTLDDAAAAKIAQSPASPNRVAGACIDLRI